MYPAAGLDFLGVVRAVVYHRQQDAVDFELGVYLPADFVDRL